MKWRFSWRIAFRQTFITHDVPRCGTDCFTQQYHQCLSYRLHNKNSTFKSFSSTTDGKTTLYFEYPFYHLVCFQGWGPSKKQSCFFSLGFRGQMMCLPTNPESFCSFIIIQSKFAKEKWQYLSELSIPKNLNVFIWPDHPSFNLLKIISWCKHR